MNSCAFLSLLLLLCTYFLTHSYAKEQFSAVKYWSRSTLISEEERNAHSPVGKIVSTIRAQKESKIVNGRFLNSQSTKSGTVRLELLQDTIANLTILEEWTYGKGTHDVLEGGVGYNYIVFSYNIPPDVGLTFTTRIYTETSVEMDEGSYSSDNLGMFPVQENVLQAEEIYIYVHSSYDSLPYSRTDSYTFNFDKVIETCSRDAQWNNGNSSAAITGGISDQYFFAAVEIPAAVSGVDSFRCSFVNDNNVLLTSTETERFSNIGKAHILDLKNDVSQYQIYRTILVSSDHLYNYLTNATILEVECQPDWKSGTGLVYVSDGGVGFEHVTLGVTKSVTAYGSVQCNMQILLL